GAEAGPAADAGRGGAGDRAAAGALAVPGADAGAAGAHPGDTGAGAGLAGGDGEPALEYVPGARLASDGAHRTGKTSAGHGGGVGAGVAPNLVDYSWSVTGTALPFWALLGAAVALTPGADKVKVQHGDTETRRGQDGATGRGRAARGRTPGGDGASSEHLNT